MVLGQMGISKAVLKYSNIEGWIRDNSSVVLRQRTEIGCAGKPEQQYARIGLNIDRFFSFGFGLARPWSRYYRRGITDERWCRIATAGVGIYVATHTTFSIQPCVLRVGDFAVIHFSADSEAQVLLSSRAYDFSQNRTAYLDLFRGRLQYDTIILYLYNLRQWQIQRLQR